MVIDGFDAKGQPRLRAPKRDVTTRMLLLHTAGFGYDFFNENYLRLATEHGQPSVITSSKAAIMTPLLFDPGSRVGVRNEHRLGRTGCRGHHRQAPWRGLHERIFEPLGMTNTTFEINDTVRDKLAGVHARNADGSLDPDGLRTAGESRGPYGRTRPLQHGR